MRILTQEALKLPLSLLPQLPREAESIVSQISQTVWKREQKDSDRLLAVRDVEALVLNSVAEVLAKLPMSQEKMAEMIHAACRPGVLPVSVSTKSNGAVLEGELSSPKRGILHVYLKEPAYARGEITMELYDEMILNRVGEFSLDALKIAEGMLISIHERRGRRSGRI